MRVQVKQTALDMNDQPHPMRGLTGTVIDTFSMTRAGYDCEVVFDCSHEEAAARLGMTAEEWEKIWTFDSQFDHNGHPCFEEDLDENLERL